MDNLTIAGSLLAIVAFGFAALMAALHYAIPIWTGHDLEPPVTYVWGVGGGILAPFVVWCGLYALLVGPAVNVWWCVVALCGICVASGLAVMWCYSRDKKQKDEAERKELRRQLEKAERFKEIQKSQRRAEDDYGWPGRMVRDD